MNIAIKYAFAAASLLTAALWLHGGSPLTAIVDVSLIITMLALLAWFEPHCVEVEWREWRDRPPSADRYRRAESALKLLAITVALIYGMFLLRYGTLEGYFERRQHDTIVARAEQLMASGQYEEAARYLESSVRRRRPDHTQTSLQFRLLECWLAIAEQGSAVQRAMLIGHAESLAREGIVDQALLVSLRRYVEWQAAAAAHGEQLAQHSQSAAAATAAERKSRQAAEALAGERARQLAAQAAEASDQLTTFRREQAKHEFTTLLAWGDSLGADLIAQRDKYQEALAFARPWQFDLQTADERLQAVLAAIRQQQPRDLAAGTSAKWLALRTDGHPPAIDAEMAVLDAQGHSVEGLTAKDFRIRIGAQQIVPLVGFTEPAGKRPSVVVLFDISGSTAGQALEAAKAGISHLVRELSGHADICLLAFNSSVTPVSVWADDPRNLAGRLTALQAGGGTAMYPALDVATTALRGRPSPRLIVLFSDGKDSTGIQPTAVLDRLRAEQIVVHTVALETRDFDKPAIERLTAATGGMLLTAAQAPELARRFAELSLALNVPRYRLVIPCQEVTGQLQIDIGNQNSVKLERAFDTTAPSR